MTEPAATADHRADHRSRPRRRGAALEQAILAAAVDELREVGYARMTMDSVARRAGAGKISVYRRWPGRVELALDAAYHLIGEPVLPPEPSTFRDDLLALLRFMAEQASGPVGEAMRGIVSESLGRADVARMAELSRGASLSQMREVVRRAACRGEPVEPDPAPVRLQAPAAMLQHRLLMHGPPIDDDYVAALVDEIALPLLASG